MLHYLFKLLVSIFLIAALVGQVAASSHSDTSERSPNVVMFLVDDMGWRDSGVYGSEYYETPNIDRFADQSVMFTEARVQPICSPTRASILTGQSTARHGITGAAGHKPPAEVSMPETAPVRFPCINPTSATYLPEEQYTLGEVFHDADYRTAHIGKWHLGLEPQNAPDAYGFDVVFECRPDAGPPSYFSPYGVRPNVKNPTWTNRVGNITDGPDGEYITDRLTDEAITFIEENADEPFFLNLWHYGVHGPWGHKEEYTEYFAGKEDPTGLQGNPIMASMLKSIDDSLGRIVETIDRLGLSENTIIIFMSDNGGNAHQNTPQDFLRTKRAANDPLRLDWEKWAGALPPTNNAPLRGGKGTGYEGGERVPLIWSWPHHIQQGVISDELVAHIDLYPTLLELCDIELPQQHQILDGVSLVDILEGQATQTGRGNYFSFFPNTQRGWGGGVSVRSGKWKLIRWFGFPEGDNGRYQLFDLERDLGESNNLASELPEIVKNLDQQIDVFLADTNAVIPVLNPDYVR